MSTADEAEEPDPRSQWRTLPPPVNPHDEGIESETLSSDFDVKPEWDPIVGRLRHSS